MATASAAPRPATVGMTQEDMQLIGNPYVAGGTRSPDCINKQVTGGLRKTVLESRIEFEEDSSRDRQWLDGVQGKYVQLAGGQSDRPAANGVCKPADGSGGENVVVVKNCASPVRSRTASPLKQGAPEDGIPRPRVRLHAADAVTLEWRKVRRIGAGLVNVGNTCFLNSVLQCLTYCPPLANYLLQEDNHAVKCKSRMTFCMMCELQRHMKRALEGSANGAIRPGPIVENLRNIAKQFRHGSQEDAHEFLRYVVDHLTRACIASYSGNVPLDRVSKETTVIHEIFGGHHRSQVTCLECKQTSNTYDLFMDFILDIKGVQTLTQALEKSVEVEILMGDNAYECPRCRKKVRAQKRFTVHRPPKVATIQFKRFDSLGHKVSRHVVYTERLDLRPYMSDKQGGPLVYRLFGVLVHSGSTCNSGHYFCYVKNSNGSWYLMNDQLVQETGLNKVLSHLENAYILFYVRHVPKENVVVKKSASLTLSNGPSVEPVRNGHVEPSWKKLLFPKSSSAPTSVAPSPSLANGGPAAALHKMPALLVPERAKISFGIRPAGDGPAPAKRPAPSDGFVPSKARLVPYAGNSSDTDEERKAAASRNETSSEPPKVKIGVSTWNVSTVVAAVPSPAASCKLAVGWNVTNASPGSGSAEAAGREGAPSTSDGAATSGPGDASVERPFLAVPVAEPARRGDGPAPVWAAGGAQEGGADGAASGRGPLPASGVPGSAPATPRVGAGDERRGRGNAREREEGGEDARKDESKPSFDVRAGDAPAAAGRGSAVAEEETRRSRGERFEKFLLEGGAVLSQPAYPVNGGYGDRYGGYRDQGGRASRRGDFHWKRGSGSRYPNYEKLKRMGFLVKNNGYHQQDEGRYGGNPFQEAQNFRNNGGHRGGYRQESRPHYHKHNFDNRHRGGRYRRPANRNRYSPWTV